MKLKNAGNLSQEDTSEVIGARIKTSVEYGLTVLDAAYTVHGYSANSPDDTGEALSVIFGLEFRLPSSLGRQVHRIWQISVAILINCRRDLKLAVKNSMVKMCFSSIKECVR